MVLADFENKALFCFPPPPIFFEKKWKYYNKKTSLQTRNLQFYIYFRDSLEARYNFFHTFPWEFTQF